MKYIIKLLESFSKKEALDIINNFSSIKDEVFTKELQDTLLVDIDLFNKVISAPIVNTVTPKKDFAKALEKMPTTKTLIYRMKFILLSFATNYYDKLTPNYNFHKIPNELPGHAVIRINGNDSIRFKPEVNSISIRDIASHSKRGY